jgi:GT2 family glycosyltransferase
MSRHHGKSAATTYSPGKPSRMMSRDLEKTGEGVRLPLSIGVVTHERAQALSRLLDSLQSAIAHYDAPCELIIANNSGSSAHQLIEGIVRDSGIDDVCEYRVFDSPENSIAVGRNLILAHAQEPYLVFVDDDEYPVESWLTALVDAMHGYRCALVAGPILPVFPQHTATWIRSLDLHNAAGLASGDRLDYASSGNFLINRQGIPEVRFNAAYGKSGGEDTEFFLRLQDLGLVMRWCAEAIVYEDIPPDRASARYLIRRFMTQGRNYRRILEQRGELGPGWLFSVRAAALCAGSLFLAVVLLAVKPSMAGAHVKRGFSNLGKIVNLDGQLYE